MRASQKPRVDGACFSLARHFCFCADPNASSGTDGGGFFGNPPLTPAIHDCRQGCLFSILEDPEERHDLREHEGAKAAALLAALEAANRTLYDPPPGKADLRCCEAAAERGGFIGPWLK